MTSLEIRKETACLALAMLASTVSGCALHAPSADPDAGLRYWHVLAASASPVTKRRIKSAEPTLWEISCRMPDRKRKSSFLVSDNQIQQAKSDYARVEELADVIGTLIQQPAYIDLPPKALSMAMYRAARAVRYSR